MKRAATRPAAAKAPEATKVEAPLVLAGGAVVTPVPLVDGAMVPEAAVVKVDETETTEVVVLAITEVVDETADEELCSGMLYDAGSEADSEVDGAAAEVVDGAAAEVVAASEVVAGALPGMVVGMVTPTAEQSPAAAEIAFSRSAPWHEDTKHLDEESMND